MLSALHSLFDRVAVQISSVKTDPNLDSEMQRVLARLVERIRSAAVDPVPNDNIYLENVFTSGIYAKILECLPDESAYDFIVHPDAVLPDGTITRKLLDLNERTLPRLSPKQHAFWKRMLGVMTSPVLLDAITTKFAKGIAAAYGDNWPEFTPIPVFYRDYPGYRIGIHPDIACKVATMQFYFPRDTSQIHLGTSFHIQNETEFVVHKTNEFKPNSAYAFVRAENSWHSVQQLAPTEKARDTLALTVYIKGTEYQSPYRPSEK